MGDQNDTVVLDLGSSGANAGYGCDTITIGAAGASYYNYTYDTLTSTPITSMASVTIPNGGYTVTSAATGSYTFTNPYTYEGNVNITTDGITMKEGTDIKVGGKSLLDAIGKIEERLGILHPNPALEDRWEQLKTLRQQYLDLEKELLEKEKMWKILKEK